MFNLSQKTKGFNAVLYKKHVSFVIFNFLCYDRILDFRKEDILWQKELLEKEGIAFKKNGCVDLKKHIWAEILPII